MAKSQSITSPPTFRATYIPSPQNVRRVRFLLTTFSGLPPELTDLIIDFAEYWPVLKSSCKEFVRVSASVTTEYNAALLYHVTREPIPEPLREGRVAVKNVKFRIRSWDQGQIGQYRYGPVAVSQDWNGQPENYGTYSGSGTWFEACILRTRDADAEAKPRAPRRIFQPDTAYAWDFDGWELVWHDAPLDQERQATWRLQTNVCASSFEKQHEVVWSRHANESLTEGSGDGMGFVAALKPGDHIGVWAREMASSDN